MIWSVDLGYLFHPPFWVSPSIGGSSRHSGVVMPRINAAGGHYFSPCPLLRLPWRNPTLSVQRLGVAAKFLFPEFGFPVILRVRVPCCGVFFTVLYVQDCSLCLSVPGPKNPEDSFRGAEWGRDGIPGCVVGSCRLGNWRSVKFISETGCIHYIILPAVCLSLFTFRRARIVQSSD